MMIFCWATLIFAYASPAAEEELYTEEISDTEETLNMEEEETRRVLQETDVASTLAGEPLTYETDTLKITIETRDTSYTRYYLAHVETFTLGQVRSALTCGTYGDPRATVSQTTREHGGILGINASGFSWTSGVPCPGKTMIKDSIIYNDVYSNGNIMCIAEDGGIFTADGGLTCEYLLSRGITDTFCFGPTLVLNGLACVIDTSQFHETYRYQRCAIGMVYPGNYYILVADGKGYNGSQGMNYQEMQKIFLECGCDYAYNFDGGGSATLYFNGQVVNNCTDSNGERDVGDVLYFIDVGVGEEGSRLSVLGEEGIISKSDDEDDQGSSRIQW